MGATRCAVALLLLVKTEDGAWKMRNEDRKLAVGVADRLLKWIVGHDDKTEEELQELRGDWVDLLYPSQPSSWVEVEWQRISAMRENVASASSA